MTAISGFKLSPNALEVLLNHCHQQQHMVTKTGRPCSKFSKWIGIVAMTALQESIYAREQCCQS